MKRVLIESPYAGDIKRNVEYAKECVKDCLRRGESPYASHLFFTQDGILNDDIPEERRQGIMAGLAWEDVADMVAIYADFGVTDGMKIGLDRHKKNLKYIEVRYLYQ
jgi:hypothetical protein